MSEKKYDVRGVMQQGRWKFAIYSRYGNHQVALTKSKAIADKIADALRGLEIG